jgi:hypothetical protein
MSTAQAENSPVVVDETPISPVRSNERRNSLEKHLQHRPDPQDLKNRHILLDTTTAPYVMPLFPAFSHHVFHPLPHRDFAYPLTPPHTVPSKPKPSNLSANAQPTTSAKA